MLVWEWSGTGERSNMVLTFLIVVTLEVEDKGLRC